MRELDWAGLSNARDLGGLPLADGTTTKFGRVVRSDHPSKATSDGWQALRDYGIRTIVSLQTAGLRSDLDARENPDLRMPDYLSLATLRLPVQDAADTEYMQTWAATGLWGTPLFFGDALAKWPAYYVEILNAVASARRGVLLHCVRGHDRTGIVVALLLSLIGVKTDAIVEDYMHDSARFAAAAPDAHQAVRAALRNAGTSLEAEFSVLDNPTTINRLKQAGLSVQTVNVLKTKLTGDL